MTQLEFGMHTELWSSLLELFGATSPALQSLRLDLNNAFALRSSLADFLQSQRDLFYGYKSVDR